MGGRPLTRLQTLLLASLLLASASLPGVAAAAGPEPKVAVIVGPVGDATERYLARGEAAARAAEAYTSRVVRVFTPNATWSAVKRALKGASVVVYLGHGNGWPSPYRDGLYPPTQNGFGLNPVAGRGNDAHQYFGEGRIAAEVELAPNAVVLLHNLCYASGSSEPGLPEGSIADARLRVDNYAAGFIRAGASAVLAEATIDPAWYVREIFTSRRSIDRIWAGSPSANGHAMTFASERSPGFTAAIDPEREDSGFYRSIVARSGLLASQVTAAGPGGSPDGVPPADAHPTLVGRGVTLGTAYIRGRLVAGEPVELWIPYTVARPGTRVPLTVGVRWDPIDVSTAPTSERLDLPIPLVQPEQLGSVVEPVAPRIGKTRIRVPVTLPASAGRYRLVLTLHDLTGVAYDAASQALVHPLIVRVGGALDAVYRVAPAIIADAGTAFALPAAVANAGSTPWGRAAAVRHRPRGGMEPTSALLVAHWVSATGGSPGADEPSAVRLPAGLEPGATAVATLELSAPATPGTYLLLVDIVVPDTGSLAAAGVEPAIVRVTVERPGAPLDGIASGL